MDSISIGGSTTAASFLEKPSIEIIEGYSFDSGYLSPYFAQGLDQLPKEEGKKS